VKRTPLRRRTALRRGAPLPQRRKGLRRSRMRRKLPRDWSVWTAARDAVLAEEPRCRACGAPSTVVHHLRNGMMGKRDHSRPNLVALCRPCHDEAHRHPKLWWERYCEEKTP